MYLLYHIIHHFSTTIHQTISKHQPRSCPRLAEVVFMERSTYDQHPQQANQHHPPPRLRDRGPCGQHCSHRFRLLQAGHLRQQKGENLEAEIRWWYFFDKTWLNAQVWYSSAKNFAELTAALLFRLFAKFINAAIIELSEFLPPHFAHLILTNKNSL